MQDAILEINDQGFYDFTLGADGDIATEDAFNTAILYSLFGERRATASEIQDPRRRRGWIGNGEQFQNGSKIWLFQQSRLTRTIITRIADEAEKALEWLVEDGFAVNIEPPQVRLASGLLTLSITIRTTRDTISGTYTLWEATGNAT